MTRALRTTRVQSPSHGEMRPCVNARGARCRCAPFDVGVAQRAGRAVAALHRGAPVRKGLAARRAGGRAARGHPRPGRRAARGRPAAALPVHLAGALAHPRARAHLPSRLAQVRANFLSARGIEQKVWKGSHTFCRCALPSSWRLLEAWTPLLPLLQLAPGIGCAEARGWRRAKKGKGLRLELHARRGSAGPPNNLAMVYQAGNVYVRCGWVPQHAEPGTRMEEVRATGNTCTPRSRLSSSRAAVSPGRPPGALCCQV